MSTGWDDEEPADSPYYHIFTNGGPLDDIGAICIEAPRTPENDADVEVIVAALNRIASRL